MSRILVDFFWSFISTASAVSKNLQAIVFQTWAIAFVVNGSQSQILLRPHFEIVFKFFVLSSMSVRKQRLVALLTPKNPFLNRVFYFLVCLDSFLLPLFLLLWRGKKLCSKVSQTPSGKNFVVFFSCLGQDMLALLLVLQKYWKQNVSYSCLNEKK